MTIAVRHLSFTWRVLLALPAAMVLLTLIARAETVTSEDLSWARDAFPALATIGPVV